MLAKEQISLYIEERQDIIEWDQGQDSVEDVLIYITNDIKQKYQTDILSLRDEENQHYEINQILEFKRPHTFITIPHRSDVLTLANKQDRESRSVYSIKNDEVTIAKYKGKRKTETTIFKLQTIRNLNKQYDDTLLQLLDNLPPPSKVKNPQLKQTDPESPKFGNKSNLKESGNDGISPSWILKKNNTKMGVELKPYTREQLAEHNQPHDAWIAINTKIYDVTYYLDKHPGGRDKLMLGVGRDGTALFNQYHPWVNCHYLLEKFQVGFLVNKL